MSIRVALFLGLMIACANAGAVNIKAPAEVPDGMNLIDADAAATQSASHRTYIVQMTGDPALRYEGGVAGFAATAPAVDGDYEARAGHVQQYASHLMSRHDALLGAMGAADRKIYSYCHTMNAFAARLSDDEVAALRKRADVVNVFEDFAYQLNTNNTSDFLGLNDRRDGLRKRLRLKGEDIVIGVIDTGAVPQHPSFAETRDFDLPGFCDFPQYRWQERICKRLERLRDKVVYDEPEDWNGICQVGEGWTEDDCNNKLIGARYYVNGFTNPDGTLNLVEGEFVSPRDSSGHGSHTASTAGGNNVVARLNGQRVARISGMAPRARIAVYKACWLAPGEDNFTCFFSDSAMATEDAVLDGVDVINFSVGTAATFVDTQDLAFLDATSAGVFVARSAGNDGPGFGTTNAGEPWVTSVAASTTDGTNFTLGALVNAPASLAGTYPALEGAITQPLSESGPITDNIVAADPIDACGAGLNNTIDGQIALIARGTCGFVEKVENAVAAGAAAVLMYTDDRPKTIMGGDATPITTTIPGVMIDNDAGLALLAAVEGGEAVNVTLDGDVLATEELEGSIMADFSSRGPYLFEEDWLKPDITAPGVRILAADSPDQADGSAGGLFGYKQGTSMSSPHIAGLAALLREARPEWSPAQIKSALMTTARQDVVKEDGETPADPFDYGAGHVEPNPAVSPRLTYDAGVLDYLVASCGTNALIPPVTGEVCDFFEQTGFSTSPADLNLPSIAIGALPGSQTVTRTVTAVADYSKPKKYWWWHKPKQDTKARHYTAEIEAPPGFAVEVSPAQLYLAPGQSASYELTITNEAAAPNSWQFGAITWTSKKGNDVRSPIAVNAAAFVTAEEVDGAGADGSAEFDLSFGYTGDYTAGVHGLNDASGLVSSVLADGGGASFDFGAGVSGDPSYALAFFDAPPGTAAFRYSTYSEYTAGGAGDDIDLYLYYCPNFSCTLVDSSAQAGSDETVEVQFPIPANAEGNNPYLLFIQAFDMASPATDVITFEHSFGIVDDAGNLTVTAPNFGNVGETVSIGVEWTGLATGLFGKQLGAISHSDPNGVQALTILDIQNDAGIDICTGGLDVLLGRPVEGCPAP
ncbi:MAG: S8 family serine peptidase [Pseudomonadota bacterium]